MRKNIIRIFAIIFMLAFVLPMTVFAAENVRSEVYGESTIYMHDLGDLLTEAEEDAIIEKFGSECENISYNVLFLTTNDTDGKSTMVYSDDYMDELFPSYEHNIAFVIDMDNRNIYVKTMGNAILCLTESMIERAIDECDEHIVDGEYADCFDAMATYCISRLNDNPGSGAVDTPIPNYGFFGALGRCMVKGMLPSIVITAIVIFILIVKHNKANKAQTATTYVSKENYDVLDKDEVFVRSYETVQKDYYKPKESSSGGGGSSHRSSSGRSHGGGGRSF